MPPTRNVCHMTPCHHPDFSERPKTARRQEGSGSQRPRQVLLTTDGPPGKDGSVEFMSCSAAAWERPRGEHNQSIPRILQIGPSELCSFQYLIRDSRPAGGRGPRRRLQLGAEPKWWIDGCSLAMTGRLPSVQVCKPITPGNGAMASSAAVAEHQLSGQTAAWAPLYLFFARLPSYGREMGPGVELLSAPMVVCSAC